MIVPQMSSNTDGHEDKINYDLDTSIVIQSRENKKSYTIMLITTLN